MAPVTHARMLSSSSTESNWSGRRTPCWSLRASQSVCWILRMYWSIASSRICALRGEISFRSKVVEAGASDRARLTDGDGTARSTGSARRSHSLLEVLGAWQARHGEVVSRMGRSRRARQLLTDFESRAAHSLNFSRQSRNQTPVERKTV